MECKHRPRVHKMHQQIAVQCSPIFESTDMPCPFLDYYFNVLVYVSSAQLLIYILFIYSLSNQSMLLNVNCPINEHLTAFLVVYISSIQAVSLTAGCQSHRLCHKTDSCIKHLSRLCETLQLNTNEEHCKCD